MELRHFLVAVTLILLACAPAPGEVSVTFEWGDSQPTEKVWIYGWIAEVNPTTMDWLRTVAELAEPHAYEEGVSLDFTKVPNGESLVVSLELRGEPAADARTLWYGMSKPFALAPGTTTDVQVSVVMSQSPTLDDVVIVEAVGPDECPGCLVSSNLATLKFTATNAAAVHLANGNQFVTCFHRLEPDMERAEGPTLTTQEGTWTVADWDLDCGLSDPEDGPRSVYLELIDGHEYVSQTIPLQIVVDRQPPTEEIISSLDGSQLVGLETTLLFGVLNGDEMWVEACRYEDYVCEVVEGFLLPCDEENVDHIEVEEWTTLATQGCVRFKDDSVDAVRAKFRDFAQNESPWAVFEFDSVVE